MNELNGFGERLKSAIKESGFSQKDVSEILQINQDTITNYVKEKSLPNADVLFRLCRLLKVSSDFLLFGKYSDGLKEEGRAFEIVNLSDEEKEIISKVRSGLYPIFDNDIKRLTGEVGRLNDQEHDLILKYRQLDERERDDIYDNVCWRYDRSLRKKVSSQLKNGGTGEEAATSEAV
jgi:transcriptional regulator with XRE-family HTH domain